MDYCPDWPITRNYKIRQFKHCKKVRSPSASHEGTYTSWSRIPLISNPDIRWSSKFHITVILFPGKNKSDTQWIWGRVIPRSCLEALQNIPYVVLYRRVKMKTPRFLETSGKKQSDTIRRESSILSYIPSSPKWLLPFVSSELLKLTNLCSALPLDNSERISQTY